MAKAKGKKITIEEALVPVEEQPYEIPENWCWTFLNAVCVFENGYAFKSDKFGKEGIPVIRISNIQENEVDVDTCVKATEVINPLIDTLEDEFDDAYVLDVCSLEKGDI